MSISIRKFLIINLLLAVVITAILSVVGNYFLDERDIQKHLDSLLLQSALMFHTTLGDDLKQRNLDKIEDELQQLPQRVQQLFDASTLYSHQKHYNDSFQFILWNDSGNELLRSSNPPNMRFLNRPALGFSERVIDDEKWRIYTLYDPTLKTTLVVAERYDMRNELVRRIAVDDLYIMLWTYPLSGLLIWMIIGRGMQALHQVANEVSQREPTNLEPVNDANIPDEIRPIIHELNKLFLRLQSAIDREKRFAADAAHELRTPLAALRAQAQVALNVQTEAEREATLHNVITCVDRSTHVVQQLLTLSRLVPEATTIDDVATFDLAKLASEVLAQLAPSALQKNIDIELIADEKNQARIFGNATSISILLRNVVDNAIRYTQEGGAICVKVTSEAEGVVLSVRDNGPGIPPEFRSRVFERFFRVLGNRSTGSGLGLSIVQQIARIHHAKITLGAPPVGTGLEISLVFPIHP